MSQIGDIFIAGIGEVSAGELAGAFEQMSDDGALAEEVPVVERPAEFVNEWREEERGIGDAAGEYDVGAIVERLEERRDAEIGVC